MRKFIVIGIFLVLLGVGSVWGDLGAAPVLFNAGTCTIDASSSPPTFCELIHFPSWARYTTLTDELDVHFGYSFFCTDPTGMDYSGSCGWCTYEQFIWIKWTPTGGPVHQEIIYNPGTQVEDGVTQCATYDDGCDAYVAPDYEVSTQIDISTQVANHGIPDQAIEEAHFFVNCQCEDLTNPPGRTPDWVMVATDKDLTE